jgi:hypothetical protein
MSAAVRKYGNVPREFFVEQRVEAIVGGRFHPGTVERIGRKYVYVQLDSGGEPVAFSPGVVSFWQNRGDR